MQTGRSSAAPGWATLWLMLGLVIAACPSGSDGNPDGDPAVDGDSDIEMDGPEDEREQPPRTVAELLPIAADRSCTPAAAACDAAPVVDATYASYRKDYFFPTALYQEPTDEPLNGGRFQIATVARTGGQVTAVEIDGIDVEELLRQQKIEWYHVWPQTVAAGEPVWVAFHSRRPEWDTATSGRLTIRTADAVAVETAFPVAATPVPITYVTTDEHRERLLVHLTNTDTRPHTATRLVVNGRDVLASGIACLPSAVVEPGEAVLWQVPLCRPLDLGAAWTVAVEFEGLPPSVGVGRVIRPFFPIEAWPASSECPLPGVNDPVHRMALEGGIDTLYIYWNGYRDCGYDRERMFFETLPARGDTFLLLGDDFPFDNPPSDALPNRESILGFLTGDESDWNIYDENGYPNAAKKAARTRAIWTHWPDLFTYNGAMTNKRIGTFAGMADVQGIDLYAGACAPHVTDFGFHPPLRAPYDYLRNARNNHMPLPTWLYAQGIHGGWATQPARQEVLAQALSVAAAGGKGLMWFAFRAGLAGEYPEAWAAMVESNRLFRGVRGHLREGDITGLASSDGQTIVELIRSRRALVVPVITLAADAEPTDEACLKYQIGVIPDPPRWILAEREIEVRLSIPADFPVTDAFETTAGAPADLPYPALLSGRELTLSAIPVDNATPVRLFVLAADGGVRAEVAAAMAGN